MPEKGQINEPPTKKRKLNSTNQTQQRTLPSTIITSGVHNFPTNTSLSSDKPIDEREILALLNAIDNRPSMPLATTSSASEEEILALLRAAGGGHGATSASSHPDAGRFQRMDTDTRGDPSHQQPLPSEEEVLAALGVGGHGAASASSHPDAGRFQHMGNDTRRDPSHQQPLPSEEEVLVALGVGGHGATNASSRPADDRRTTSSQAPTSRDRGALASASYLGAFSNFAGGRPGSLLVLDSADDADNDSDDTDSDTDADDDADDESEEMETDDGDYSGGANQEERDLWLLGRMHRSIARSKRRADAGKPERRSEMTARESMDKRSIAGGEPPIYCPNPFGGTLMGKSPWRNARGQTAVRIDTSKHPYCGRVSTAYKEIAGRLNEHPSPRAICEGVVGS